MLYDYVAANRDEIERAYNSQDKLSHAADWRGHFAKTATDELLKVFQFVPAVESVTLLPHLSFGLSIDFVLQKPYLSKDDSDFYIIDNPVRKDRVFKVPIISASGWKGALRATLYHTHLVGDLDDDQLMRHPIIDRLFGSIDDNDNAQVGWLQFFPTFFGVNDIGIELINPHERDTGVGTVPIPFECVKEGAKGQLLILYVPLSPTVSLQTVVGDLQFVAQGLADLLTRDGFGAKTSSGYGTVNPHQCKSQLVFNLEERVTQIAQASSGPLPNYLEAPDQLIAILRNEHGELIDESEFQQRIESQGLKYNKQRKQRYDKARKWWQRKLSEVEIESEAEITSQTITRESSTLDELVQSVEELAMSILGEINA